LESHCRNSSARQTKTGDSRYATVDPVRRASVSSDLKNTMLNCVTNALQQLACPVATVSQPEPELSSLFSLVRLFCASSANRPALRLSSSSSLSLSLSFIARRVFWAPRSSDTDSLSRLSSGSSSLGGSARLTAPLVASSRAALIELRTHTQR